MRWTTTAMCLSYTVMLGVEVDVAYLPRLTVSFKRLGMRQL